jgi:hypothetical protein
MDEGRIRKIIHIDMDAFYASVVGAGQCVVASRHAGERVDIANPKSLAALFDRVGEVDGIVCTGGAARFKPWDHLTDDDLAFSLANKLMGTNQCRASGRKPCPPRWDDHADVWSRRAVSRPGQRDHHDGQRGGREQLPPSHS